MAKYLLVLRDNGSFEGMSRMSPEEIQKILGRYRSWSTKLRERGKLAGGEKLRDREGKVIKRSGSKVSVTDGPFAEVKEVIGGFYILEAKDYDEAVSLANDCPHLDFGSIEVREIEVLR